MRLPYQTIVLESPLAPQEARERLEAAVEPVQLVSRGPRQRPFEGTVEGTTFHINRIITYRNSFRPQLHGRIETTTRGGARVVVSFQLHPVVLVLLAFGVWFFAQFWPLGQPSASAGGPDPHLVLIGILAFVLVLVLGCFIPEASKAEQLLKSIIDAPKAAGETGAA
jgi:hypothetical protein